MIPSLYDLYSPYRVTVYYFNIGVRGLPIRFALPVPHANETDLYNKTYSYFKNSEKIIEAMNCSVEDATLLADIRYFFHHKAGCFYIAPKRRIFYKDNLTGTLYMLLGKNKIDYLLESSDGEIAIFSKSCLRNKIRFAKVING